MSHDYSQQSMDEDPRMMAFFDSLVQRELEGWSTDESPRDSGSDIYEQIMARGASDDSSSTETNHSSHSGEDDGRLSPFTLAFASAMARRARQDSNDTEDTGHQGNHANLNNILDQLENESEEPEAGSSSSLPGQRPNSARKSITDLINQKRKEYMSNANVSDSRKKLKSVKKKRFSKLQKRILRANGEVVESSLSSSDSSSSSSDAEREAETNRKRKKRKKRNNSSETESDSPSYADRRASDVLKELAAERKKTNNSSLQKLRKIRNRLALNSQDSDSNEETNKVNTASEIILKNRSARKNSSTETTGQIPDLNSNAIPRADSLDYDKSNSQQEKDLVREQVDSCENNRNITDKQGDETVALFQNAKNTNGLGIGVNADDSHPENGNNSHLQVGVNGSEEDIVCSVANGVTSNANSVGGERSDSQPTWTEFKRFKNRVERARRHYRQRTSMRNSPNSSDEES